MALTTSVYSKISMITCFTACIGDFVVTSLIGFLYSSYNPLTDSESYLGTDDSPLALYMNAWEVLFGFLLVSCAYCLYKAGFSKSRLQVFASWLIAIYGMGEGVGSGLFPFNHVRGELTNMGWFHSIFSGIGITAMVILSFVLVKLFPGKPFCRLNKILVLCSVAGAIFILLCLLSRKDFIEFVGLWQRLYLVAYYFMLISFVLHIFRSTRGNLIKAS